MRFGDNLRNLRIQRGLTQMELAKAIGTSQSSITSWESERREPDFKSVRRIADFFGVPLSTLIPNDFSSEDDDHVIVESLHTNPKLRLLFSKSKFLSETDLDAVLSVVNAITREREADE